VGIQNGRVLPKDRVAVLQIVHQPLDLRAVPACRTCA
jgi:hypothetical protein